MKNPLIKDTTTLITDTFNLFKQHFISNNEDRIGIYIAPHFCVLGEFIFYDYEKKPISNKWTKEIVYEDYIDLETKLSQIIRKRCLYNRVVSISFSIPEIYTTSNFDPNTDLEEQNILPKGIEWENIDYSVQSTDLPVFAAIRQIDIHFWTEFIKRIKLIPGNIIPTGYFWHEFFPKNDKINCKLPCGTIYYDSESPEGVIYVPVSEDNDKLPENKQSVVFSADVAYKFSRFSHTALLPLEPIVSSIKNLNFNLNIDMYHADTALRYEPRIWRWMSIATKALGSVTIILITIFLLIYLICIGLGKQRNEHRIISEKIEDLRKENIAVQSGIVGYRELLSQRSSAAKTLSKLGKATQDSLWFSELKVAKGGSYSITIIGHSLNESCISKLLSTCEKLDDITLVKLEYTEKLSQLQVAKLTYWKRKIPLYRFKVELAFNL